MFLNTNPMSAHRLPRWDRTRCRSGWYPSPHGFHRLRTSAAQVAGIAPPLPAPASGRPTRRFSAARWRWRNTSITCRYPETRLCLGHLGRVGAAASRSTSDRILDHSPDWPDERELVDKTIPRRDQDQAFGKMVALCTQARGSPDPVVGEAGDARRRWLMRTSLHEQRRRHRRAAFRGRQLAARGSPPRRGASRQLSNGTSRGSHGPWAPA